MSDDASVVGAVEGSGADVAAERTAGGTRRANRRTPEVRIGFPGWAPFAFVGVFAAGVALGAVLMLFVDGDDTPAAAATTTPATLAGGDGLSAADAGNGADVDDALAFGTVEITGTPLPRLGQGGGPDPAVGMPAPGIVGADFNGTAVSIADDGSAKMILFVAHWCPYCREEIPKVRDWVDATPLPDGVDLYSVSTLTDPARSNYPPATWLALEGWDVPLIADDGRDSAATAFGLNAVPFWVLVNSDNTIAGRGAGAVPTDVLDQVASQLSAGA